MDITELPAGAGQTIVVYQLPDTGNEIDPIEAFRAIAADAERRAEAGQVIVSTTNLQLRHGGVSLGIQGSGFTTKIAVAVVYSSLQPMA